MKERLLILLILVLLPFSVFAKDKEKNLHAGALLSAEIDLVERTDLGDLGEVLGYLTVTPHRLWKFTLQVTARKDAVRLDEVWGEYNFSEQSRIRFGIFENSILMEDAQEAGEYFADNGILREMLYQMGWYTDNSAGGRYSRETEDLHWSAELFFMSSSSEILIRGDINKPLGPGRMGASLIYHPYLFHNMWSEEESSSHWSSDRIFTLGNVDQRGIYEINYFLIDLYWGDLTGEKDWVYKTELTLGSNLADPVGYLGFQGGKNRSEFFGGDLMLGRVIGGEKFNWVPSVNCTGYMASIEEPNLGSIEVRAGNRWCWNESLTVFLDTGLVIKNYNQQKESGETLMTGIDGILNLKAQYSF